MTSSTSPAPRSRPVRPRSLRDFRQTRLITTAPAMKIIPSDTKARAAQRAAHPPCIPMLRRTRLIHRVSAKPISAAVSALRFPNSFAISHSFPRMETESTSRHRSVSGFLFPDGELPAFVVKETERGFGCPAGAEQDELRSRIRLHPQSVGIRPAKARHDSCRQPGRWSGENRCVR